MARIALLDLTVFLNFRLQSECRADGDSRSSPPPRPSLYHYGPYLASSALQHGNNNSYVSFLSPPQQVANTVLENTINIPPTLEKNQGETVSIFVAHDPDFGGVYDLRASQ